MYLRQLRNNLIKMNQIRNYTTRNLHEPFTIAIEGNIGSGKTSFLNYFSENENVRTLSEPVELWRNIRGHNLLDLMYKNTERYGFTFQTYVQLTMLQIHELTIDKPIKMMERSIYSARYCFLENLSQTGLMIDAQKVVLDEWFNWITLRPQVKCDLIIYLRVSPEICLERIRKRCRDEEKCVPIEYLRQLHKLHENWLFHKTSFPLPAPVLVFDASKDMSEMEQQYQHCEEQFNLKFNVTKVT